MTENAINQVGYDDPLKATEAFVTQCITYFSTIQSVLQENEQLKMRIEALETENAALTDTLEQWKKGDEWSSRVTYENMVDQIAACEDPKERDEACKLIEPLLKRGQVNQLRKDIKRRVKELNDENDTYSDKQVAQALEACVGKGLVVDAKWKWAGVYWYLRWTCNYPVDVKSFCTKINGMDLAIDAEYECSYESIRKICTLSFMDEDARRMDVVRVSKNDQGMFSQCREIVLKLAEELSRT